MYQTTEVTISLYVKKNDRRCTGKKMRKVSVAEFGEIAYEITS